MNIIMNMKSIITTYPDFQSLPRGVKKMLLASENYFFREIISTPIKFGGPPSRLGKAMSAGLNLPFSRRPFFGT
jgi:hypothetical protein